MTIDELLSEQNTGEFAKHASIFIATQLENLRQNNDSEIAFSIKFWDCWSVLQRIENTTNS